MKKHIKKPKTEKADPEVVESLKAAAARTGETLATIKAAKAEGCPAFKPGNRIHIAELVAWLALHPEVRKKSAGTNLDNKIKAERLRKFKMENDERDDLLVKKEWVSERLHLAAGKVDAFRQKSEAEHPLLFAAAMGDVAQCREVVRKIWDEVMASMNSLKSEFSRKGKEPRE